MKSFKRKEQLTLHIVIHSGEKKHVCIECGKGEQTMEQETGHIKNTLYLWLFILYDIFTKLVFFISGFYRKDHLRKHTRSHIARRVKSEVSAQNVNGSGANNAQNNSLHGSWGSYKDFW